MIDFDFIERLIQVLDASSVDSLEIERGGTKVRLSKTPPMTAAPVAVQAAAPPAHAPAPAGTAGPDGAASGGQMSGGSASAPPASDLEEITSPMVGTFYRAPAPDAPSYVDVGDKIAPGDTLCIIEAMKLMNELDAEISGEIVEVLVENAQPVEFGQVLFRVSPR
ncbi:MAG: acetyl-CoA carboxylase biotin carboxyl carrier protein [Gemmatimonadetes bacterium]|nr:acetyl-CoA carboxylase biotin carboxyl carrier protein [Gemmatimonadota bacterium]NNF12506.1 acetyl-CoA carboxylase biotin carboxyl carrier protein [Gemmatimonadota bacterium]NNL30296.1 acetyl-CoA carboxylase biotin carboxyl carrier protein [Gemmatimonadota bacterium]